MTPVLIVDDDPLVRRLLATVLTAQGIVVAGEASDGDELVDAVAAHHPDVVLLDLTMRRMGGREALTALRRAGYQTAVVVLSSFGTDEALELMRAGAVGFLGKDDDPDKMADQIRSAAAGRPVVGQQALGALVRHASGPAPMVDHGAGAALAALTAWERDVVAWLPLGSTNAQIAARLYLSDSTVETHLSSAMAKLGLTSREQVAVLVDRAGLTARA